MEDQIEYLKKQVSILVNLYNTGRHEEVVQKGKVLIKKNFQIKRYLLMLLLLHCHH